MNAIKIVAVMTLLAFMHNVNAEDIKAPSVASSLVAAEKIETSRIDTQSSTSKYFPQKNTQMPSATQTIFKAVGGLLVVLATIFGVSALAKRIGLTNVGLRKRIQLRESILVGQKERLVLVDFSGQSLLLGVSAGGITLLKSAPQLNLVNDPSSGNTGNSTLGAKTAIDFQQKLNDFLLKGQK